MANVTYGQGLQALLNGYIDKNVVPTLPNYNSDGLFYSNIAQSRYFTVTIDKLLFNNKPIKFRLSKPSGEEYTGKTKVHVFEDFFPVKNISISFTSYDNMSIPFAIFGNLPILHRKQLAKISINAYDFDDDRVEMALQRWEQMCFPSSKYVAYLDEVAAAFEYISYDVTGRPSYVKNLNVIPADSVQVSRGYDDNSEKIVSFSLVAVGEPGASANGSGGNLTVPSASDSLSVKSNNPTIVEPDGTQVTPFIDEETGERQVMVQFADR